jgi:hypothetical protein
MTRRASKLVEFGVLDFTLIVAMIGCPLYVKRAINK